MEWPEHLPLVGGGGVSYTFKEDIIFQEKKTKSSDYHENPNHT